MKALGVRLRHYLLISLCLAFMSGILLQQLLSLTPRPLLLLSFFLILNLLWVPKKSFLFFTLLIVTVMSLAGLHAANLSNRPQLQNNIYSQISQEEDAVLVGTLYSMPEFDGEKSRVLIKSRFLQLSSQSSFRRVQGLIQLRLKQRWPQNILPGDEVAIRCLLGRPYRFANPGGFDYPAFLKTKNIYITGRIVSPALIHKTEGVSSWLHRLKYFPERLRVSIQSKINSSLPSEQAALYRALLIGDRSGLSPAQLEAFKAAGVFHILAISGLHLSLLASGLFMLFYWLGCRSSFLMLHISVKKLALLTTIIPLCAYALLAGFQTPVLRSLLMILVFILAFCARRQHSPFTTLSSAALLILVLNPQSLFTLSFQLSFTAVGSLIIILPQLKILLSPKTKANTLQKSPFPWLQMPLRWIGAALLISITATLGTAPLLIHGFNRLSTVGPLANLIIEPLLCLWSLPLGLLSLLAMPFSTTLGESLLQAGAIGIRATTYITGYLSNMDISTLWLATPSVILILLYYIFLSSFFFSFHPKKSLLLFLLVCTLFVVPPRSMFRQFELKSKLVFLDVGQGSSTLLNFPGGRSVLIDGGGSSSSRFNVGPSIIAPYLWDLGIRRLESVVITHPDSDHFNGIPFILKRFRPRTLWINGNNGHSKGYTDLLELAELLGIFIRQAKDGQTLIQEEGVTLKNIQNPLTGDNAITTAGGKISSNDESLILKFTDTNSSGATFSCLFPGDISSFVEQKLLQQVNHGVLHSTFLLAPHHGSRTSNSAAFLQGIKPQAILVSAGSFQPALFPSVQLKSYCRDRNLPLFNTAILGALRIQRRGESVELSHFDQESNSFQAITKASTVP